MGKRLTLPVALLFAISVLIFVLALRYRGAGEELAYAYGVGTKPAMRQFASEAEQNAERGAEHGPQLRLDQVATLFRSTRPEIDRFLQSMRAGEQAQMSAIAPVRKAVPLTDLRAIHRHPASRRTARRGAHRRARPAKSAPPSTFARISAAGSALALRSTIDMLHLPISPLAVGLGFVLGLLATAARPRPRFRSLPPGYFAHRPLVHQSPLRPALAPRPPPVRPPTVATSPPSFGARRFLEF